MIESYHYLVMDNLDELVVVDGLKLFGCFREETGQLGDWINVFHDTQQEGKPEISSQDRPIDSNT